MRTLFGLNRTYPIGSNKQIDDQLLTPKRIKFGVPQVSIIGPLFFLLCLNHIISCHAYCLQNSDPSLYADDAVINTSSHDFDELMAIITADLDNIRK